LRSKLILMLIFLLVLFSYAAEKTYGILKIKEIVKVYDGDTFTVILKKVHPIIGDSISIRIRGIDTPEIRGGSCKDKALRARNYFIQRLEESKKIELRNVARGKYFRIVADVYLDRVSIADEMILLGLAKPYDGGAKIEWSCDQ